MTKEQILEIIENYKLRIPPTVFYDLKADIVNYEEEFEWCHDCKEYDQEQHCCHRWTKVIRNTVEEMKQEYIERDVLDKIRAEIKEWYWQADKQALAKDPCVVDAMIDLFIRTIDKYKAETEEDRWK